MRGMHELQMLNVEKCVCLGTVPNGLAPLTSLSPLTEFKGVIESTWSKLRLLKNFSHPGRIVSLIIRLCSNNDLEGSVEDAREAELRNKIQINELHIMFEDEMNENVNSCRVRKDVIDALEPRPNLLQLTISKYKGSKLSGWTVSPLNQLWRVHLIECHQLTTLPSFGKLPRLEEICINRMDGLEIIGREFLDFHECSNSGISFPKLTRLEIKGAGEWKKWEDITAKEEVYAACSVMPCLTHLMVIDCSGLTALPHRLIRKASSLKILDISGSTQLQQLYGNKDRSHWKFISINNPGLQLKI